MYASRRTDDGHPAVDAWRDFIAYSNANADILLGWTHLPGGAFYVRQLWDGKITADLARMSPTALRLYGEMCGWNGQKTTGAGTASSASTERCTPPTGSSPLRLIPGTPRVPPNTQHT